MKFKRDIYCEYEFWEAFYSMEEEVIHDRVKRRLWDAFHEFISKNNIFFNIKNTAVNEKTDGGKNLDEIRQARGGAGIHFLTDEYNWFPRFNNISNKDNKRLNSVYLTMSDTATCKKLSGKYGIIVFNLEILFSAKHVFTEFKTTFDRVNHLTWDKFLSDLKTKCPKINYCNSLLLNDHYFLSNCNKDNVAFNLSPILDALLPQNLCDDIVFNICILAEETGENAEEKKQLIRETIQNLRPKMKFNLDTYNKWVHDRAILTNNVMLTSGTGFNPIEQDEEKDDIRARKSTMVSLSFPFLQSDNNDNSIYLNLINEVNRILRFSAPQPDAVEHKEVTHRLLDYYYNIKQKSKYNIKKEFCNHPKIPPTSLFVNNTRLSVIGNT